MVTNTTLPITDLDRLHQEILTGPPEAALPVNMNDEWLNLIARDLDEALNQSGSPDKTEGEKMPRLAAPLALVAHILLGREGAAWSEVPLDELYEYCQNYLAEITLEMVRRKLGYDLEPASLETILKPRNLSIGLLSEAHDITASEIQG